MKQISFNQVTKSYNGKSGCACGCNGKYTLPSHVTIEDANAETGYNAYDASDISDRRVKIALNKINKAIETYGESTEESNGYYEFSEGDVWFCYSPNNFVAIDINGRATTIYFMDTASEVLFDA